MRIVATISNKGECESRVVTTPVDLVDYIHYMENG